MKPENTLLQMTMLETGLLKIARGLGEDIKSAVVYMERHHNKALRDRLFVGTLKRRLASSLDALETLIEKQPGENARHSLSQDCAPELLQALKDSIAYMEYHYSHNLRTMLFCRHLQTTANRAENKHKKAKA